MYIMLRLMQAASSKNDSSFFYRCDVVTHNIIIKTRFRNYYL